MAASAEEEPECVVEVLASRGSKDSSAAAAEDHDDAPATIGEVLAVQSALREPALRHSPVARAVDSALPPGLMLVDGRRGCEVLGLGNQDVVGELERHAVVMVWSGPTLDGDGEDLPVDEVYATVLGPLRGRVLRTALRSPDRLDTLALGCPPQTRSRALRLASALRGGNAMKTRIHAERLASSNKQGNKGPIAMLLDMAEETLADQVIVRACEDDIDDCEDIAALANLSRALQESTLLRDKPELRRKVDQRGRLLVLARAVLGDPKEISHHGTRGMAIRRGLLADLTDEAATLGLSESTQERLRIKAQSSATLQDHVEDGTAAYHSVHLSDFGVVDGDYVRRVTNRGWRRPHQGASDEESERLNRYAERQGHSVYFNILEPRIQLRIEEGKWAVVRAHPPKDDVYDEASSGRAEVLFRSRGSRMPPCDWAGGALTFLTTADFAEVRKLEGNAYFELNRSYEDAFIAESLYTEAIETFTDDIPRRLRVSLLLNRAETRLSRLRLPYQPRSEEELERSRRPFLKEALRDTERAWLIAQGLEGAGSDGTLLLEASSSSPVEDADARPLIKRAKIRVELGDVKAARADIAAALRCEPANPAIRQQVAALKRRLETQKANTNQGFLFPT